MQRAAAANRPRALSAATALVFGGGLALYQMTSLVLGAPTTRQLNLSLSIPALDRSDRADPVTSSTTIVLGILAPAVGTWSWAGTITTAEHRHAATSTAAPAPSTPATSSARAAPVPTCPPRPSEHARPTDVATSQPPRGPKPY